MNRGLRTQTRVLLAGLVPLLLLALLLSAYLIKTRLDENQLGFERQGTAYAKELAAASRYGLFVGDESLLQQIASQTLDIEHVYSVEIISVSRKHLVDMVSERYHPTGDSSLQTFEEPVYSIVAPLTESDVTFETAVLPETAPTPLGSVRVTLTSADMYLKNHHITRNSVLIVAASFILALVLLWMTSRYITRPIDAITRVVKHAESGQFDKRVPTKSSGSLGELEVGINNMMDALDRHKNELIDQVEEATEELQLRNAQLDKARKDALSASRVKSEFLAHMSHEIRTPMNGIIGFVELLSKTTLDDAQKSQLDVIKQSAHNLLAIINQILDFSKIESGKIDVHNSPTNIREIVESTCQLLMPQALQKQVALNVDIDRELPNFLQTDPVHFRQIISNLVSNAVKYTDAGEISVNVTANPVNNDACEVEIKIKDTGIGIAQEDLDDLFEPFTQADINNRQYYQGTGLGLTIVKRLVETINGIIDVESVLHQGSAFSVHLCLPVAKAPEAESKADNEEYLPFEDVLKSMRILVVDDNKVNRHLLRHMLGMSGAGVVTATNGQEAVEAAKGEQFDLIIMDIHMPKMGGMQASRYIRALKYYDTVPIIALSADAVSRVEIESHAPEIDHYLTKPINEEELFHILSKLRTSKRSTQDQSELAKQQSNKSAELLAELLSLFREELPLQLEEIDDAVAQQDWQRLRDLLHKLKGAAAVCDTKQLYERISRMQKAVKDEDYPLIELLNERLHEAVEEVLAS